jgi:subtilase family serine protease
MNLHRRNSSSLALCGLVGGALLVTGCGGGAGAEPSSESTSQAITVSGCTVTNYQACYTPAQLRHVYGLDALLDQGFDGKGETIILLEAFGSPTIENDLKVFDAAFGIPDPPSLKVIAPQGTVPYNSNSSTMVLWAAETTVDVQWAHAMAPGASIVILTSPVTEGQGGDGLPQMTYNLNYALEHNLGNIVSMSWDSTENTFFTHRGGLAALNAFEAALAQARAQHVTAFVSSGDTGSANTEQNDTTYYPFPTVEYPASSANVTAVGGTTLLLNNNNSRASEVVWNDLTNTSGASGGGVSQYFAEPSWQTQLPESDQKILNGHRGLPDVAFDADFNTGVSGYVSFPNLFGLQGWVGAAGGTSLGAPCWAGIMAIINQVAGRPIGFLNDKLPIIASLGFLYDITVGNNAFEGLPGYSATPGWDPASGWGTPNLAWLGLFTREDMQTIFPPE